LRLRTVVHECEETIGH